MDAQGRLTEFGVAPDVRIDMDEQDRTRDAILDTAIDILAQQTRPWPHIIIYRRATLLQTTITTLETIKEQHLVGWRALNGPRIKRISLIGIRVLAVGEFDQFEQFDQFDQLASALFEKTKDYSVVL